MKKGGVQALIVSLGFGLYKAAVSLAYSTAMGSVSSGVGFISELDFMFAVNGASVLTAAVLLVLLSRGKLKAGSIPFLPAVIAIAVGFAASMSGVLSFVPVMPATLFLGALCGFSIVVLCAAWLEVLAAQETARAVTQLVGGLFIQCLFLSAAPLVSLTVVGGVAVVALVLSAVILVFARRWVELPAEVLGWKAIGNKNGQRLLLVRSYACLFVLVGVVGILHTSVLGSSSEHIVGGVNMLWPRLVSLIAAALAAALMVRRPNPTFIYKICLPAMLIILSLLPFFGEMLGSMVGLVMIACYEICGVVFLLFIVEQARSLRVNSYGLSIVYMGGSSFVLFIGLAIGRALNALSVDYGLSLLTLLAFAAIYPLVLVLIFVMRKGRTSSVDVGEDNAAVHDEGVLKEDVFKRCLEGYAETYGLTKRETEILGYLARGRSARFIAETLVISENTVWAHIKRVYSKMDVHDKQELMSLVERDVKSL